jgi:hypothetical protein
VTAIILLDSDSNRLLSKYYQPAHPDPKAPAQFKHPFQSLKEQRAFELGIWEKTRRASGKFTSRQMCILPAVTLESYSNHWRLVTLTKSTGDILLYSNHLVLYKASIDLTFYIVGPEGENELMLQGVLNAFYDAVSLLLRHSVEKRAILESLDLVVLAMDETVDNG